MSDRKEPQQLRRMRVWDLPVRLFHWMLVALIVLSIVSANIGGNAMRWHELSGISILTLVLFRIAWGFCGSSHARFSSFIRGVGTTRNYARLLFAGRAPFHLGHNPLGGWMIIALIVCLLVQTGSGLFANDDVMLEGPLAHLVTKETSDWLTRVHHTNLWVLCALIALHVAAALYYLWVKRDNLIAPLFSGRKNLPENETAEGARGGSLWIAVLLFAACAGVVYFVVR